MELFALVARDDIAGRWRAALKQDLTRLPLRGQDLELPKAGVCIVHWDALTPATQEQLLAQHQQLVLIVLTDHPDTDRGRILIRRGVKGYGNTFVTSSLLQEMVKTVERGDIWAGPEVLQSVLRQLLGQVEAQTQTLAERYALSDREQEVLAEVMTGSSNKIVARQLDITERTVKAHMSAILSKTGAHDRVELILLAQNTERSAV